MVEKSLWTRQVERDPEHSHRYIQRFKDLAAAGNDLHGEARLIDAMVGRGARILDAGCGPGRVGGELARRGHIVVGIDVDPVLIAAAEDAHPDATWLVGDLAELNLLEAGISHRFDIVVMAGNVMAFLAPSTRRTVLVNLAATVADDGRLVIGFGSGRGYGFPDFLTDVQAAGLTTDLALSTWDVRPWTPESNFLVAVLRRDPGGPVHG